MNEYTRKAAEDMKKAFDGFEVEYTTNEKGNISVKKIALNNNLKQYHVTCTFDYNLMNYAALLEIAVDKPNRQDVAEFVARANYAMKIGHFDFDMEYGCLAYRIFADCRGGFNKNAAELIISACDHMIEQYGDGILKVMHGKATPKEAAEECDN